MSNQNQSISLQDNGVINLSERCNGVSGYIFKVEDFLEEIKGCLNQWDRQIVEGLKCEVLIPGSSWQSGECKIKLSVEFYPDASSGQQENEIAQSDASPLDEIRLTMNEG